MDHLANRETHTAMTIVASNCDTNSAKKLAGSSTLGPAKQMK